MDAILSYRPAVRSALKARLSALGKRPGMASVAKKLTVFCTTGKLVRGCLALYAHDALGGKRRAEALDLAVAIELLHSGILIHDDVIDRDATRRGKPTIHTQYAQELGDAHLGNGLAICAGDIAIFEAFRLLGGMPAISPLIASELGAVAQAEMDDVSWSVKPTASEDAVLRMYRTKTARYTFSVPLMAGAMLAGSPAQTISGLERFGESAGLLFQLQDDILGILGDAAALGKPVGSDIREDKTTILRLRLFSLASVSERAKLKTIFGNPHLTLAQIRYVRELIATRHVLASLSPLHAQLANEARAELTRLAVSAPLKATLEQLVAYNLSRTA